jgi:hypothetical protein
MASGPQACQRRPPATTLRLEAAGSTEERRLDVADYIAIAKAAGAEPYELVWRSIRAAAG